MQKSFFIDTSRCTACRGCQVACKEWKNLPAVQTKQRGSHQNPEDLNPITYKLVRFKEYKANGTVVWNFFSDQCRHCLEPPCKMAGDQYVEGAALQDPRTGAVVYTELTKMLSASAFEEMKTVCPYNIPRRNWGTGLITKCDMCFDRVSNGLMPVCVKSCPTQAMNFGDRDKMMALAEARLSEVKKSHPKSQLVDKDALSVIYLLADEPKFYHEYAIAQGPVDIKTRLAQAKKNALRGKSVA